MNNAIEIRGLEWTPGEAFALQDLNDVLDRRGLCQGRFRTTLPPGLDFSDERPGLLEGHLGVGVGSGGRRGARWGRRAGADQRSRHEGGKESREGFAGSGHGGLHGLGFDL